MKSSNSTTLGLLGFLLVFGPRVDAQSFSQDWLSIDAGGQTSSGGPYSMRISIAQTDTLISRGGPYSSVGGFWGILYAIQMPGTPSLSITRQPVGIVVSWPQPGDGYILEEASNLTNGSTVWSPVTIPYQTNANKVIVSLPATSVNKFYRLQRR